MFGRFYVNPVSRNSVTLYCIFIIFLIVYHQYSRICYEKLTVNKQLSFVKFPASRVIYDQIFKRDNDSELDFLEKHWKSIYDDTWGKCAKRSQNFNDAHNYWNVKPEPCS